MIQYIETKNICPHPDNPRKDLGDLTELADSIQENGILQNLTVVPETDGYKVVIGHRRLAAAKAAGLTEVPCVVKELDSKTQVATMLLENMQRSDLTPYEQAQGFQMMLDLGETVFNISKKTGLSETTVRHRVKLCELDPEILKEKAENVNLFDLIKLEKIKDPGLKNKVLKEIGTNNFDWTYRNVLKKEKNLEKKARLLEILSDIAEELTDKVPSDAGKEYIGNLYFDGASLERLEASLESYKQEADTLYYRIGSYQIDLYKDREENEQDSEVARQEEYETKARRERTDSLERIYREMMDAQEAFIKDAPVARLKEHTKELLGFAIKGIMQGGGVDYDDLIDLMEPDEEDARYLDLDGEFDGGIAVDILAEEETGKMGMCCLYLLLKPCGWESCFDWDGRYRKNNALERTYQFLETIGYSVSDEEKQMLDGTHPLYTEEAD